MKKQPPAWLRWAYLAAALFIPIAAWLDFRDYRRYNSCGLFSPERWTEIVTGFQFRWALQGMMAVCFLYSFLVLTWNRNGDRDRRLLDEALPTVLLLFWGCLPLLIPIFQIGSIQTWWVIILVAMASVTGYSWVKYFEEKQQEEETYE